MQAAANVVATLWITKSLIVDAEPPSSAQLVPLDRFLTQARKVARQPLPDVAPAEPGGMPAPGFGEGFGDRRFAQNNSSRTSRGKKE
jgi:hypothetical protein